MTQSVTVTNTLRANMQGFRSSDNTGQPIRLDKSTNSIQSIDYAHHEVHAGSHFYYTDSQTIGSGAATDYLLTTPNTTKWAHMTFSATGSAITQVDLYEGTDKTGVAAQTVFNNNRNSSTDPGVTVHRGVTGGTTDGTKIWTRKSGAASQQSRAGMEATHLNEKVLKQNTKYILRITSGTADNLTNLQLNWYEHTDIG